MKKNFLVIALLLFIFNSCSKEAKDTQIIRGKTIYAGSSCHQKWGVQIIDGPQIGEPFESYNNVIEVYNIPSSVYVRTQSLVGTDKVIELKIRDTRPADFEAYNNCPTREAVYTISNSKKAFVSLMDE